MMIQLDIVIDRIGIVDMQLLQSGEYQLKWSFIVGDVDCFAGSSVCVWSNDTMDSINLQ